MGNGSIESSLSALEHLRRYQGPGKTTQKNLALSPRKLPVGMQSSAEFNQSVIEEWTADFQTVTHAGSIRLDQNVVHQPGFVIHVKKTIQTVQGACLAVSCAGVGEGIKIDHL